MRLSQKDLIKKVQQEMQGLASPKEVEVVIRIFLDDLYHKLLNLELITISHFGSFSPFLLGGRKNLYDVTQGSHRDVPPRPTIRFRFAKEILALCEYGVQK